jgi:dihydroorotate dehydrogenase subfamily 2
MGLYTDILKPILFQFPPEKAQKLGELALSASPIWKALGPLFATKNPILKTRVAGIELPSPIGLAAGYDKNCHSLQSLSQLGFGYIIGGTIVSKERYGNPKPRIVRIPEDKALANSLGFPSEGLSKVLQNIHGQIPIKIPLFLSISGVSEEELLECYTAQAVCSAIELNISSPNTEGIRIFQDPKVLKDLLQSISTFKRNPLFIKLPPFFGTKQITNTFKLIDICLEYGVDGVTVANTWPIADSRLAVGRGGLSGRPLIKQTLDMVRNIRDYSGSKLIINACGGISSGQDAIQALAAGANTIQLYTAFIYEGPGLIKRINEYIVDFIERNDLDSLESIPAFFRNK